MSGSFPGAIGGTPTHLSERNASSSIDRSVALRYGLLRIMRPDILARSSRTSVPAIRQRTWSMTWLSSWLELDARPYQHEASMHIHRLSVRHGFFFFLHGSIMERCRGEKCFLWGAVSSSAFHEVPLLLCTSWCYKNIFHPMVKYGNIYKTISEFRRLRGWSSITIIFAKIPPIY
jgi:hypothetical protein